jgi:hypothetical protein
MWAFLDLQNPDNDIAAIEGVPGAILSIVGIVLSFDGKAAPVELWRLYRSRNLKLPPKDALSWWQTTQLAGRGTLAAALALCTLQGGLCPPLSRDSNVLRQGGYDGGVQSSVMVALSYGHTNTSSWP